MESHDPAAIVYTSGTTGRPKGSVHVHGGFLVKIRRDPTFAFELMQSLSRRIRSTPASSAAIALNARASSPTSSRDVAVTRRP